MFLFLGGWGLPRNNLLMFIHEMTNVENLLLFFLLFLLSLYYIYHHQDATPLGSTHSRHYHLCVLKQPMVDS